MSRIVKIRINLTKEQAQKVLEQLPGSPELYEKLADVFIREAEKDDG